MSKPASDEPFPEAKPGFEPSPCSPRFTSIEERGLRIALPARFTLPAGRDAVLPLCIAAQFDEKFLERFDYVFRHVRAVVVDEEGRKVYGGSIWRDRHYKAPPPIEGSDAELEQNVATSYYTTNLLEHVHLPARRARYRVYLTLGRHRSNVRTLDVATAE